MSDSGGQSPVLERTRHGAVDIISVQGPLNQETTATLDKMLDELVSEGQPRVALNLKETPLFDGSGLEWLLGARDICRRRGGELTLAGPNPLCRDILKATRLDTEFTIYEDALTAVGSFAR